MQNKTSKKKNLFEAQHLLCSFPALYSSILLHYSQFKIIYLYLIVDLGAAAAEKKTCFSQLSFIVTMAENTKVHNKFTLM